MPTVPTVTSVSLAPGSPSLDDLSDPLLVDPDPALLRAVIDVFRNAAPALVDPDLDELRAAAEADADPLAKPTELPLLTVLADEHVVDEHTDEFRPASRLAALIQADVCRVLTGLSPQPNPVLAGDETGCVLVPTERDDGRGGDDFDRNVDRWAQIGDDSSLRERYASLIETDAAIDEYGIRTPSRHRV